MRSGVTMVDPDQRVPVLRHRARTRCRHRAERGVRPGVSVEAGATIHAFSHPRGRRALDKGRDGRAVRAASSGAESAGGGRRSAISSRVKKATDRRGRQAAAPRLRRRRRDRGEGDLGAGTITCNYDGFDKHLTRVGERAAFVGSNTSLVAPVTIGAGAYVGSGSVVTQNVPDDALARRALAARRSSPAGRRTSAAGSAWGRPAG